MLLDVTMVCIHIPLIYMCPESDNYSGYGTISILLIIRMLYFYILCSNSGLQSRFTKCLGSSAGSVLCYHVNGKDSLPIWAIFCYILLPTLLQFFFVSWLGLAGS